MSTTHSTNLPPASQHGRVDPDQADTGRSAVAMAVLRVALGFVFLWAFLDKTFGLSYSTPSARSWLNGGSPTDGFLSHVEVGPFQSQFHSIAGTWWADWAFMLGLLFIGVALILGVAVRLAAIAGVIQLVLMWFAVFPPAQHTSTGAPTGSTNPIVDDHLIYALVLIVFAFGYAGSSIGLGGRWARLPFVQHNRWAL